MGLDGVVPVDVPGREAGENLVEGDGAFEPGEGGAEAEVDAVAEGDVVVALAVDVEAVGVGERRSSRFADAVMARTMLPAGRVWPWCSASATYWAWTGEGDS